MTQYQTAAIAAIGKQQPETHNAVWCVGEQLKDLARREPESARLLAEDLETLTLVKAEQKIKAYADAHKTGNFAFVPPQEAERILREFYGLPSGAPEAEPAEADGMIDLADFL